MKKVFALFFAWLVLQSLVFAQGSDPPIDETTLSEIENGPAGTADSDFEGILPAARLKCLGEKEPTEDCKKQAERYSHEKAGELGRKIENGTIEFQDIPIFIVKLLIFLPN